MAIKAEAKPDPASKAEASQPTTVATQREKPTPDAHIHYAAPLSASDWLGALKQAVGSKTAQGGGGESFPKSTRGAAERSRQAIVLHRLRRNVCVGTGVRQGSPSREGGRVVIRS